MLKIGINGAVADEIRATLGGSEIQIPMDMQSRMQTTWQTHNAVYIAGAGNNYGTGTVGTIGYIDTDGYDRLTASIMNDAATSSSADVCWSHDAITDHIIDTAAIASNTTQKKGTNEIPTKARYMRLKVNNADAAAHTISAWVYLKT
jgi:hypothetical protein